MNRTLLLVNDHQRWCCRRQSNGEREPLRGTRDVRERDDRPSRADRSSRDHQDGGARRRRSRSRSTGRGSGRRRAETGFSGEAGVPAPVAGDPNSAAAAGQNCSSGKPAAALVNQTDKHQALWAPIRERELNVVLVSLPSMHRWMSCSRHTERSR